MIEILSRTLREILFLGSKRLKINARTNALSYFAQQSVMKNNVYCIEIVVSTKREQTCTYQCMIWTGSFDIG
jgi:hypothetical protein